ncbi:hypothetical protein [Bdellovibrio sp.]|uniref:hypothetical protein n=1 Tax=Bdellovibrio sp. TaxID=28201 RepID=UPI003221D94E
MKVPKPKSQYAPTEKERIEYKNVSYRLPAEVVNELAKYVDKKDSASALVADILRWALPGLKQRKGGG